MKLKVYDREYFTRTKTWFISFFTFFACFIVLMIFVSNLSGGLLLFFVLGAYIMFGLTSNKKVDMVATNEGLKVGGKFYPWGSIDGFVLETAPLKDMPNPDDYIGVEQNDYVLKNIVILQGSNKLIHTFADENESIKEFLMIIQEAIPMIEDYNKSFVDKIVRLLKL